MAQDGQGSREIEIWKVNTSSHLTTYQVVNMQGQAAMKAALLINGGASIALLAFIGSAIANSPDTNLLLQLSHSMIAFTAGVVICAIAFGTTYLAGISEGTDNKQADEKGAIETNNRLMLLSRIWKFVFRWRIFNGASILLVIVGYVMFVYGSVNAYMAFVNFLSL